MFTISHVRLFSLMQLQTVFCRNSRQTFLIGQNFSVIFKYEGVIFLSIGINPLKKGTKCLKVFTAVVFPSMFYTASDHQEHCSLIYVTGCNLLIIFVQLASSFAVALFHLTFSTNFVYKYALKFM